MKRILNVLCILGIVMSHHISYAQDVVQRKVSYPTLYSVVEYRSWEKEFGGEAQKISQFSAPTMFKLPVTGNIAFDVMGTMISSSAEDDSLSGPCDVKARAVTMLADDAIMFTAGMNLPSGKSDLSSEEAMASALLSDKALGFKYNKLGEGLDINLGCGLAKTYEPVTLGVGLGYLLKGEYGYLEEEADSKYKPGDQFNVTGGFDLLFSPLLLRSDLTYTIYQADMIDDSEVLKEGTRLSISETVFIPMDRFSILLSGRYVTRGETELLYAGFDSESRKLYGNQLGIDGILDLQITKAFSLKLLLDGIFIGENDSGQNDARVFGIGSGINLKFMRMSYVDITGQYRTGTSNDDDISLKGISTTAAVRVVF